MKNKGLVATIVIMSGIIVMLLVTLLLIKMPSIVGIDGFLAGKVEEQKIETSEKVVVINEPETVLPEKKVKTEIMHYSGYNGNVDIEYPEISGMDDIELQSRLNYKIKTNALSIVPLYPISTALQKLDIYCEVKSLDDRYITILYTGKVVGKDAKEGSKNLSSTPKQSTTAPKITGVKGNDPYLNGFVDPLAAINAMQSAGIQSVPSQNNNAATSVTNGTTFNSLPLPQSNMSTEVFKSQTSATSVNNNSSSRPQYSNTADQGPTVTIEPAPTREKASNKLYNQNIVDGNYSTNNPTSSAINTNNNSSSGVVYSGNTANQANPLVPNSNAPDSEYGPGNLNKVNSGAPVYGYSGSNTSARTIDQSIFYTNTIDLVHCVDVPLSSLVEDMDALAKYARSSKAELVNIDPSMESEVRTYIRKTVQSKLAETLKEADFRNVELKIWPKHFSYSDEEGNIYFTIKLSSKLGNYVIIKYSKSS